VKRVFASAFDEVFKGVGGIGEKISHLSTQTVAYVWPFPLVVGDIAPSENTRRQSGQRIFSPSRHL
jgi:hypothetical protein